eukprot:648763_1
MQRTSRSHLYGRCNKFFAHFNAGAKMDEIALNRKITYTRQRANLKNTSFGGPKPIRSVTFVSGTMDVQKYADYGETALVVFSHNGSIFSDKHATQADVMTQVFPDIITSKIFSGDLRTENEALVISGLHPVSKVDNGQDFP